VEKPNDVRGFVHKRIIGAVRGGLTGGFGGAIGGFVEPQRNRGTRRQRRALSRRRGGSPGGAGRSPAGLRITGPNRDTAGCFGGAKYNPRNDTCELPLPGFLPIIQRALPGGASGFGGGGTAAGSGIYAPETVDRITRRCFPGDVLGKDGFCHAKGSIPNKEREWPRGRRPLGTPGEMAALAKAASFGRRMETTVKRMQKIGVLKKPSRGRRFSPPHRQKQLAAGPSIINVE